MKCIKKMNDFVLGILMILLSAFLVFGKITETEVKTGQGGFLVRSDVWLRMMGVFLVIVAVILIIRSFGKKEGEEAEGFHFYLDSTVGCDRLSDRLRTGAAQGRLHDHHLPDVPVSGHPVLREGTVSDLPHGSQGAVGQAAGKGRSVRGSDAGGVLVYIW